MKLKMTKKTLYPKTKRIGSKEKVVITEKLDGSNLGIFKIDGELLIAQRNNTFIWRPGIEVEKEESSKIYKGLLEWLNTYGEHLINSMYEGSGMFGEWIAMGKINYSNRLDKRFYIFAKANLNENLEVTNIIYNIDLFIYPFIDQVIPDYIGVVPVVLKTDTMPNVADLDNLYFKYVLSLNEHTVTSTHEETKLVDGTKAVLIDINTLENKSEGFIINNNNTITKYVRLKGGILQDHQLPK